MAARAELVLLYLGVLAMFLHDVPDIGRRAQPLCLNRPIIGAYEITEKYLMVASIFLGLSYAYRGGIFIRVTFLVDRLPPALEDAGQSTWSHLITLAFCLIILIATTAAGDPRAGRTTRR